MILSTSSSNSHGKKQIPSKSTRRYLSSWGEVDYKWIRYDHIKDKVFCSSCVQASEKKLPLPTESRERKSFEAFVFNGFDNWKKSHEKFRRHEVSHFHRAATEMLLTGMTAPTVSSQLTTQHLRDMKEARQALEHIFSSLVFLGCQGLAIRGKTQESSNLFQLLKLRSTDAPILEKWMNRQEKYKWISPEITNEILLDISLAIQRELTIMIKEKGFYGFMMDESSDNSGKEQV